MDDERFWVKVGGMDRIARLDPPDVDAQPFAHEPVAEFGDRVVPGDDWPHPNHDGPVPDAWHHNGRTHRPPCIHA